jgi:hypothetical protein
VYLELTVYDSHLFGRKDQGIDEIEQNGTPLNILPNKIPYMTSTDEMLMFGMSIRLYIYKGEYTSRWNNIQFNVDVPIQDITCIKDKYYVAEGIHGIRCYELRDNRFVNPTQVISINSPSRDLFYHIKYTGNRFLAAGGINTQMASYYPVTFMCMEENGMHPHWTLFDETTPKEAYPHLTHYNAVDLVQDPNDANHFYGAVYRNGLHEYRMDENGKIKFVRLFNYENSPLKCIDVDTPVPWNYCTCTALQYDSKGNLWMANQQTDTIVRIMRPNGKWISLYYPEIVKSENVFQYLFSSHDINFMVTYEGSMRGFFGFDTNGTKTIYNPKTGEQVRQKIEPQESVWYEYEKIITDNYSIVSLDHKRFLHLFIPQSEYPNLNETYRRCWTKDINHYAEHYNNIDVLLVPLKECDFSKMKSQLKVIEAGFFNKGIIAQNFGPYTIDLKNILDKGGKIDENGNALLVDSVKNHKQWAKYIKLLVENPEILEKMKVNLYNTVKDKYSIETVCKERVKTYLEMMNQGESIDV